MILYYNWESKTHSFSPEASQKYKGGERIINNFERNAGDQLLRECYKDLTGIYRQLENTIQRIEDRMWNIYEKYEIQFLKEYDALAKKYGEEYRNIDDLPNLVKNRLELKE